MSRRFIANFINTLTPPTLLQLEPATWAVTPEHSVDTVDDIRSPSAFIWRALQYGFDCRRVTTLRNRYNVSAVSPLCSSSFCNAGQATAAYDPRQFNLQSLNWYVAAQQYSVWIP